MSTSRIISEMLNNYIDNLPSIYTFRKTRRLLALRSYRRERIECAKNKAST